MTFVQAVTYIMSKLEEGIHNIDNSKIENAVTMIKTARHVFVYGAGRSGEIGKAFAMRLVQLGITTYFIGETVTPIVTDRDLTVLISNKGTTKSTVLVAQICKNVRSKIIVITNMKNAPLLQYADLSFIFNIKKDKPNLAPLGTLFELNALLFLDSLIAQLMVALNETDETMHSRHAIWV